MTTNEEGRHIIAAFQCTVTFNRDSSRARGYEYEMVIWGPEVLAEGTDSYGLSLRKEPVTTRRQRGRSDGYPIYKTDNSRQATHAYDNLTKRSDQQ